MDSGINASCVDEPAKLSWSRVFITRQFIGFAATLFIWEGAIARVQF
jgi:hypothetical protein